MPIQIGAKGATIGGVSYPAYFYVDWLTPDQEAQAMQGGDAVAVPARRLTQVEMAALRRLGKTNRFTRIIQSRLAAVALSAQVLSTYVQIALAARPARMRVAFPNRTTGALTGVRACVAPTATLGLPGGNEVHTPSGGTSAFVDLTWAAAASHTMPAAVSAAIDTDPGLAWSDWFVPDVLPRADGLPGYLFCIRSEIPGSTAYGGFSNSGSLSANANSAGMQVWEDTANVGWRIYRQARRSAGTGGVTNKALENGINGNGVWNANVQAVWVQYDSLEQGEQLGALGDSLSVGDGGSTDRVGYSWLPMLADMLHAHGVNPVEVANLAVGTTDSVDFTTQASFWLTAQALRPTLVFWAAFTPNIALTTANVKVMKDETAKFLALARSVGVQPLLWTGLPSTPVAAGEGSTAGKDWSDAGGADGTDSLRRAYNAEMLLGGMTCDIGGALSGAAYATGQIKLLQAFSRDGLHLSPEGNLAAAQKWYSFLNGT